MGGLIFQNFRTSGKISHSEVCYGLNDIWNAEDTGVVSKNTTREEYIVSLMIKKGVRGPQRMESTRAQHCLDEELWVCRDLPGASDVPLESFFWACQV